MKQIKNKPASILSKLKNIARKEGIDYNLILTLYAQSGFRMKDFYDIYILSKRKNFDGRVLQEAIMETFQRRGTPIERNHPIFQSKFIHSPEKQLAWSSFRKRVREKTPETFDEIMKQLITFLLPIYNAICDEEEYFLKWDASSSR